MRNSKLYSILEHFDKYEQNRCRKYIQSPYFNKNETLLNLYEIFIDHINTKSGVELTKEDIWLMLNPQKGQFDDVRFRKFCSDLLKLIEGFLSQQIFEENPLHQATYLIEAVGNKKLEKLYNSTMKSARRLTNSYPFRIANYYHSQYQIEKNYYDLTNLDTKRQQKSNVEKISDNLDYFYFIEKLRLFCEIFSRQHVSSHDYKVFLKNEIIDLINKFQFDEIPALSVYYQIFLLYTEPENEDHFYKLKSLLDKYSHLFPITTAKDELYMSAQNYCISNINKGNQKFLKELFILYKDLLEKELILAQGILSPWYFRNIVVISLRLGEYDWTKDFIEKYKDNLPDSLRNNAVTYNLAQLYFYQKKYDKVIENLRDVEFEDFSYNLNSKTMLLATYYETEEIDPLYFLMESFRVFLNRHKDIPEYRRKQYKNLIKFTKKLTKLMPGDAKALTKLKEEIETTKNIASIKWLKEKIAELE